MSQLPAIVDNHQLPQANARLDGSLRLATMTGPTLAGWILNQWGPLFNWSCVCVIFLCSVISLAKLTVPKHTSPWKQSFSWAHQFRTGLIEFYQQKVVWWLSMFLAVVQFGVGVLMALSLPYVTHELQGTSTTYGWFIACFPLGYFIGTHLLSHFSAASLRVKMLGANVIGGLTFIGLAISQHIQVALVFELIAGISAPFFHVHAITLFQRVVPQKKLAQLLSLRLLLIRCTMPLGTLLGGFLGEYWGIRPTLSLVGILIMVVSLSGILLPYFRFLHVLGESSTHPLPRKPLSK
ncbi:Transmembrane secretion effector [Marininema halotolerans]|uniref:Transmembrane secretion effector n=2 Tax=Marininema halotolerans TaxID=1155944 RepID=A0A1I6NVJ2_9BACL|nr:Transmembrane secretion effector [Marininema halotolerans]